MKPPYRILVTTSNSYLPALKPMAWLMNKYWSPAPEVLVMGFTPPDFELPSNFTFHRVGKQEDYPFSKWCDALIETCEAIPDEVFLLLLEDMWPIRKINVEAVKILYDYMIQFEYVARIDLTRDRLCTHGMKDYATVSYLDFIISMPGSDYHMSLQPAIWRKEHLLSVMQRDWSAHQLELYGTPILSHNRDVIVLGTRNWVYRHIHALRKLDHLKLQLSDGITHMADADAKAMREMGYFKHWEE